MKKAVNQAPLLDIIDSPICVFNRCMMHVYGMLYAVLNKIQYYSYVEYGFINSYLFYNKKTKIIKN